MIQLVLISTSWKNHLIQGSGSSSAAAGSGCNDSKAITIDPRLWRLKRTATASILGIEFVTTSIVVFVLPQLVVAAGLQLDRISTG